MRLTPALACLLLLPAPAAMARDCRLALALAIDVSASVDAEEHHLQREGIARALEHPDVAQAVFLHAGTTVALQVFEWSGRWNQSILSDWAVISSQATLLAIADRVRAAPRSETEFPTSMGAAMLFAHAQMDRAPDCDAQTIDVSGDGRNNEGFDPGTTYRTVDFSAITVNGLAIDGEDISLKDWYAREVIHGPGAFVMSARDFNAFGDAMREKLVRELSVSVAGKDPAPAPRTARSDALAPVRCVALGNAGC